jgi:hypothetical protein
LGHLIRLGPADREQPFAPCVRERLGGHSPRSVGCVARPVGSCAGFISSASTGNGEAPQRPDL